jgi:hypothetical protein
MSHYGKKWAKMFTSEELLRLCQAGALDPLFEALGDIICPKNLIASGGDTSVFQGPICDVDGCSSDVIVKIAPKNIRFFKHFGKGDYAAKDFKKYINRLDPFFLPVEEILYEDENVFVYTQQKCKLIKSKRITQDTVAGVFRLVQFMLVNDVLLTDLAPHNLGVFHKQVVVFDYHGLHRLTKEGSIKRADWWRRLARNLTRFICGLYNQKRRPEYSLQMQNCDQSVVNLMTNDPAMPRPFVTLIQYLWSQNNDVNLETVCQHLENCIGHVSAHKPHKKK